ncbi:MAG: carboxypeptidase regulatory-like domain-containing protein [Acidobacteriota bacterium]|nr:carboxypeptidase regulatory-like domain-containing protein [Acidobacteriota bacterium]
MIFAGISLLANGIAITVFAQSGPSPRQGQITIEGTVRDAGRTPLVDASVVLTNEKLSSRLETMTAKDGTFVFALTSPGAYSVRAETSGYDSATINSLVVSPGQRRRIELILKLSSGASSPSKIGEAQLEDKPDFTVAGVSDWTATGGHGSDVRMRTSEELARETAALNAESSHKSTPQTAASRESEISLREALAKAPDDFGPNRRMAEFYLRDHKYREAIPLLVSAYRLSPEDFANARDLAVAYKESGDAVRAREQIRKMQPTAWSADKHRALGDLAEQVADPLTAVAEYEQAVHLDASEANYFAWGTELLLHRAIVPSVEVFAKGARAHPGSARMLAGFGAALHASGSYEEAARNLCEASDLEPAYSAPYMFLGKMAEASSGQIPCVEQKLSQFAYDHPTDALANYYYAVALSKRAGSQRPSATTKEIEALLHNALKINGSFAEAHVQLGILYSNRNDTGDAIEEYKKAIATSPKLEEAHYRLGRAYKHMGDKSKAIQEFKIYEQLTKTHAAAMEQQRRQLKEFVVVLKDGQP